jgi:hypothetical protein
MGKMMRSATTTITPIITAKHSPILRLLRERIPASGSEIITGGGFTAGLASNLLELEYVGCC